MRRCWVCSSGRATRRGPWAQRRPPWGTAKAGSGQAGLLKVRAADRAAWMSGQRSCARPQPPLVGQQLDAFASSCVLPIGCGRSLTKRVAGVSSLGYSGAMAHALMQRAEDGPSGAASGPYSAARFQVERVHLARHGNHSQQRIASSQDGVLFRSPLVGAVRALVAVHSSCRVASSSRELGISSSRVLRRARPRCRRSSSCSRLHWRRSGQCSATVGSFEIRTGLMFEIAVHCTSSFAPMVFKRVCHA